MPLVKKIIICFLLLSNAVNAEQINNFLDAKKIIISLFSEYSETLYCGCGFDKRGQLLKQSCSVNATKYLERSNKVEMEHMFAMAHAKHHFPCWRNGGRKNCQKTDPNFNKFEAELYNLWPVVGSINARRSDYRYGEFSLNEKKQIGWFDSCPIYIDPMSRKVEPRNEVKGIVARANLFISDRYKISLSKQQRQLFVSWHNKFPPNDIELHWASNIAKIQGYENHYIVNYKKIDLP